MKLAIIGGGWAGLSAAVTAARRGHQVRVFESAAVLGGRARSVRSPALQAAVDNGQHILLGAYTATLSLMRELGLDPEARFARLPLNVRSANGDLRLHSVGALPAPLHILAGLLLARGLAWADKRAAIRAMLTLRRNDWATHPGRTVQEWLEHEAQPHGAQRLLWIPLCVATLNTPADQACAQLFAHVLRDSIGAATRSASDLLIPRMGLSELWPDQVEALDGIDIIRSHTVRRISYLYASAHGPEPSGDCDTSRPDRRVGGRPRYRLALDDEPDAYDAIVVCGNAPSTARLLATLPSSEQGDSLLGALQAFQYAPIATLNLRMSAAVRLPAPMLLLHEDRERHHYGQWLFQGHDGNGRMLHIVVSDADSMLAAGRKDAVAGMLDQMRTALGPAMPAVESHALIVEKRATFLSTPGLRRPGKHTPWPGVWIAGDWTDTGYPAVLEGAVRSGRDAVLALLRDADPDA